MPTPDSSCGLEVLKEFGFLGSSAGLAEYEADAVRRAS